jgi:hypothetical protein
MMRRRKKLFDKLFAALEQVVECAIRHGNHVAIEWPKSCSYWQLAKVRALLKRINAATALFDGCALGLTSIKDGRPIRKPWRVDSTCSRLVTALSKYTCPGHEEHAPCEGQDTKQTEEYTPMLAKVVHSAWRRACKDCDVSIDACVATCFECNNENGHCSIASDASKQINTQRKQNSWHLSCPQPLSRTEIIPADA